MRHKGMRVSRLEGDLLEKSGSLPERFERLYAAYGAEAQRVAFLLTGNQAVAEDISQDAFVRVLGKFGDLRSEQSFRPYLLRTVTNLSRSYFRRRRLEQLKTSPVQGTEYDLPDSDTRETLKRALQRLPHRQRSALILRYCEDLSEETTADVLGTSVKAVKSLTARGLSRLRQNEEVTSWMN